LSLGEFFALEGEDAVLRYDSNSMEAVGRLMLNGPAPLALAEGTFNINDGILTMAEETQVLLEEVAGLPVASTPTLLQYDLIKGIVQGEGILQFQSEGVVTQAQLNHFEIAPGPLFSGRFESFTLDQADAQIVVPTGAILDNKGLFAPTVLLEVTNSDAVAVRSNFRFGQDGITFDSSGGMVQVMGDSYLTLPDGRIMTKTVSK